MAAGSRSSLPSDRAALLAEAGERDAHSDAIDGTCAFIPTHRAAILIKLGGGVVALGDAVLELGESSIEVGEGERSGHSERVEDGDSPATFDDMRQRGDSPGTGFAGRRAALHFRTGNLHADGGTRDGARVYVGRGHGAVGTLDGKLAFISTNRAAILSKLGEQVLEPREGVLGVRDGVLELGEIRYEPASQHTHVALGLEVVDRGAHFRKPL